MRSSDPRFMTTHWSVVLKAGDREDHLQQEALQTLCQTYWFPLYAFARQQGRGSQDAEDLTQGFLTKLIEQNLVLKADRERGRFRSFLLVSFKHFMADQRDRASAKKRGGMPRSFHLILVLLKRVIFVNRDMIPRLKMCLNGNGL